MPSLVATDSVPAISTRPEHPDSATATCSDELTSCDANEFVAVKNGSQLLDKIGVFEAHTKTQFATQWRRDTIWKAFMSFIILGILVLVSFILNGQMDGGDCPPPALFHDNYPRSPFLPNMTKVVQSDRRLLTDEEAELFDEYTTPQIEVEATVKLFESGVTSFMWVHDGTILHVNMNFAQPEPEEFEVSASEDGSMVAMTSLFICGQVNGSECVILMPNFDNLDEDEDEDMEDDTANDTDPRRLQVLQGGHFSRRLQVLQGGNFSLTETQSRQLWWAGVSAFAQGVVQGAGAWFFGWATGTSGRRRRRRSSSSSSYRRRSYRRRSSSSYRRRRRR